MTVANASEYRQTFTVNPLTPGVIKLDVSGFASPVSWFGSGGTAVWNVLSPQQLLSQNGQTLTVQPDGSVLASGGNPLSDEVAFVATTSLRGITGFRLEVLADPSFPVNGPGRASNGNFVLTELLLDARTLPSIPTLETWALALTALMLMLSAVGLLRRRRG